MDLDIIASKLNCEVRQDAISKKIYSVDASIYELEPLGIVIPRDVDELLLAMELAASEGISVTARGAATGITGGCLSHHLVIDTAQYLNKIIDIDIDNEYVICQPGVVQDALNEALLPYGYRLGPDTSTGNRATLGGMLANNAAGSRSLKYGRMVDHVQAVDLALSGGDLIVCCPLDEAAWQSKCRQGDREGKIYAELSGVIKEYGSLIEGSFPKIPRHVSGYNLGALIEPSPLNLSKIIAGSEGSLGIATKIKMRIAKCPAFSGVCLLHLKDMLSGMASLEKMLAHHPMAIEMIDDKIIAMAKGSPSVKDKLSWLKGEPEAVFVAEFEASTREDLKDKLCHFASEMRALDVAYDIQMLIDAKEIAKIWQVRKAGLGLLLSKRSYARAIAFIEDVSVAPAKLAPFMKEFCSYLKEQGKEAGIYGHVGSGCMHIRPYVDLRDQRELDLMRKIMVETSGMVLKYHGSLSGEHGDGLIRSWLNESFFGKELYQAFKLIKKAFDPRGLVNPGKVVDGPDLVQDLRLSPSMPAVSLPTFLDFSAEGGIELAADLCNGNAECRKASGLMCPSFQVTQDEFDTTRARAQSLRAIIHGRLPKEEFEGDALHEVLDLCIECKGCKRDCPSEVDMAKMKSEFLYHYHQKHGYGAREWLFAHMHTLNSLAAPMASFFNAFLDGALCRLLLRSLKITTKRGLPKLAKMRFSQWIAANKQEGGGNCEKEVVLFNDTYMEFNEPKIGQAAFQILQLLGYHIHVVRPACCGRAFISKGFLKEAKAHAKKVVEALYPYAQRKLKLVVLEPSCLSAFRDDFRGLLGKEEDGLKGQWSAVAKQALSLEEFLLLHGQDGKLPLPFKEEERRILVHGHCHQKALQGTDAMLSVLRGIPGFHVEEIPSGCCGMAGAFGYEEEHYEFSMKIGELKLFPRLREAKKNTLIVANGISCRSQIAHGSSFQACHLAEAIALQLAREASASSELQATAHKIEA